MQSCFFVRIPVAVSKQAVSDTVHIYHFMVAKNKKRLYTEATANGLRYESKKAYNWITAQAGEHGQNLHFKEYWPLNKDTALKHNYVYNLPNNSLQVLMRKKTFKMVTRKGARGQLEKIETVNWKQALFDSLAAHVEDTAVKNIIAGSGTLRQSGDTLIIIHLLTARKSKICGFYSAGRVFAGVNKASVIAHESLHHLGAPDLYLHRYWFGKRRRLVRNGLHLEIMDFDQGNKFGMERYYVSNYTAYTIGWDEKIDQRYKLLLKQNLMALCVFYVGLYF